MKKLRFLFGSFLVTLLALTVVLTLTAAVPAQDLPPRPPTPTPESTVDVEPLWGAFITLHATNAPVDAWTIVQWQDASDNWHDVGGWQGHLDDTAGVEKTWWVAPMHFDAGPFRWAVYDEAGGELLGASDDFYLPSQTGEVVVVDLLLP